MKTIRYSATLYYYDGPQVFEARDSIGGHYVAVMVEPVDGLDRFLVVGVQPERLRQFRVGLLDLKALLLDECEDAWYLVTIEHGLNQPLTLIEQTTQLGESGMVPESGFVLHDHPADLKGMLDKADLGAGTWSILTENGPYSGKIKQGGPSLAGLKLGGVYHFSCKEEIENGGAAGREQRTLYLLEHEPV